MTGGAWRAPRRWHVAVERTFAYDRYYRECSDCVQRSLRLAADHSESCDWSTHITSNSWPTFLATAVPFAPHSRSLLARFATRVSSRGSRSTRAIIRAAASCLPFVYVCFNARLFVINLPYELFLTGGFSTIVCRFMTSTRVQSEWQVFKMGTVNFYDGKKCLFTIHHGLNVNWNPYS